MKLKFTILLLFAFCFGRGQTVRISNFDELMKSLNNGEPVRVIIHYAQCKFATEKETPIAPPNAITGLNIDTYEFFASGAAHNKLAFVVFSDSKLIKNPLGKGFVYNYGKVRISADNSAQVTAQYIHPKNYKILMNETFLGMVNDGKNGGAIDLFVNKP